MRNSHTTVFPNNRAGKQQGKMSLDGINFPDQNTIIVNIILYFISYGKK